MTRLALPALLLAVFPWPSAASDVKVEKTAEGHRLLRDGRPYFIKGAGGDGPLDLLARSGGNSVRTWGVDDLGRVLDEAHKRGLTVCAGIWLGHRRHGFDYNDAAQVAAQQAKVREAILRYKDHPALLLWGLGNEMEGDGQDAAVWSTINNLAALAKKLDPGHPTMTVLSEPIGPKLAHFEALCPEVDIVGINSYGGAASIPERYRRAGGTRPYIVTEFGPAGQWEIAKTAWGAAPEPTSTAKAEAYRAAYRAAIDNQPACLGSYAFLWGHKQETTATWFNLILPDGRRVAAVDTLAELWSGRRPMNLCPTIEPLKLQGPNEVEPGATVKAALVAGDPEGNPLTVRWVLAQENTYGAGGDAEAEPPSFPEAIVQGDKAGVTLKMPKNGGGYRLYAYVADDHDGVATANLPLLVKGPVAVARARAATLPFVVYDEADRPMPYAPSGFMGNLKAMKVDPAWGEDPHGGKTCLRVDYSAARDWAGVVWQSPANDWGDLPGGFDLTGAGRLTFWARGAAGGEVVTFEFGVLGGDKKVPDSGRGRLDKVALTKEWRPYAIDLAGADLTRIKTGFAWVLAAEGGPVTFFVDDIRYEP